VTDLLARLHRHPVASPVDDPAIGGWYTWGKPLVDWIIALVAVILLLPAFLLIVVAIKLDSRGPVIFCQRRLGKDGRGFTMFKFRTMVVNADDALHRAAFERFVRARSLEETGARSFKLEHDPRVTRVGRWLRLTSLDELPQLFNVLNGTMSLVGPRPPIPYETVHYAPHHWRRLSVRPGITGPWQAMARSQVAFEQMVAMDLDYIAKVSLTLDLKLMGLTLGAVLAGRGAG
jgi:lipopolysaccharide/colanic/teichoic acid biosynthesis glycosyltransferase